MTVQEITQKFATAGEIIEFRPHGGGHINDSYHLVNSSENEPDYLLQRVNHYVFKDVDLLMRNMVIVTDHISSQLKMTNPDELERRTLKIILTKEGKSYFKDPDGNYWRILVFIKDHRVYETATDPAIAYEGARMFGSFTKMLSGLDPSGIGDTIPNFHNFKWRIANLKESIAENKANRLGAVEDEIRYVESRTEMMSTIQNLGEKGAIPLRITHNDTKINNVLFDKENRGLCVIDLDTVQPGYVHFDFGDGIRTFTNTGEEDDENLDNVTMDMELYRAFASGFLDSTRDILNETEVDTLVYAGLLFPFEQGVRFLTDYLAGDLYYKTKYKEHNLVRTRAQFKLAQDGESKMEKLKEIIKSLTSS